MNTSPNIVQVVLLLNLLIAMMGDTYAKIAEIKNEWMRQWARLFSSSMS